ncbi:MAG: formylglycine-generating enzyme family protein [Prevotellaceae bacterium]|jgi:formylglycine-generating enzyme required for sulfatase activity|nr:formylglycine-generating enzyme family protein [Prevotellaceae bacterium]
MKQNYKLYLAALLLVGAASTMTAGAQTKPTLTVFVVGMDNTLGDKFATQIGSELNRNSRYTVATNDAAVQAKLADLRSQGAEKIDRNALTEWGRTNGISTICLVADAVKGSDHMFYALLIDVKDSKVNGRGSYVRTGIVEDDLPRVSRALSQQLDRTGYKHRAPAPARTYPAELDIEMVHVEGGTFTMGCTAEQTGCNANEKPTHSVTLSSFSIGKYEITQAQWKLVMTGVAGTSVADAGEIYSWKGTNCGNIPCDEQRPAEYMDWYEAVKFCNELSKKVGLEEAYAISGATVTLTGKRGYRLPTEAEWEYVARGCKVDGSAGNAVCENLLYSGSNDLNEVGWYKENSSATTHPVGQKKPNALGIHDMSGNVWEWVYDWWYASYSSAAAANPTGPNSGTYHAVRGGAWDSDAERHRAATRSPCGIANCHLTSLGLRVVLP